MVAKQNCKVSLINCPVIFYETHGVLGVAEWASYQYFSDLARKQSSNANLICHEKFEADPTDLVLGRTPFPPP